MHKHLACGIFILAIYCKLQHRCMILASPWGVQIHHQLSKIKANVVNLTREADNYIETLNQTMGNITSWSFADENDYRRTSEAPNGLYPVKAKLQNVTCEPPFHDYKEMSAEVQMINYFLKLKNGIYCPFALSLNLTLFQSWQKKFRKMNVTFDLNNRHQLRARAPQWKEAPKGKDIRIYQEHCNFTAKAYFDGYFIYQTAGNRSNETQYHTVNVTRLHNEPKGLLNEGTGYSM
uniref:Dermacentor immunosuppressant protein p36-like protein n=1 Tax=Amblyomma variegatum TaxID=34610 RepID=F0JAA2_AMBVA|nr:TPA_inf: dermacentor immunosuppressant protein p36-like protein [Amblyomma variegatum]